MLVWAPLDDAARHEVAEASCQEVAGYPEIVGQFVEAGQAQVQIAQNQWRPGIADHVERPRHRAVHGAEVSSRHGGED
jgi:hypothetical protein